jgi:hypothetical protein
MRGLPQGLTEEERYVVADAAIDEVEKHSDPWQPSESVPTGGGVRLHRGSRVKAEPPRGAFNTY